MKKVLVRLSFFIYLGLCFWGLNRLIGADRSELFTNDMYYKEHEELYELSENSIDVLYVGSSHVYSSVSPEDIFKQHGITGYVQASANQKIWQSYYYLEEALYTQNPSVVVLDVFLALDSGTQTEAYNRMAIDMMALSPAKLKSIKTAVEKNPKEEDFLSYIFPVLRYHDRWESLEEEDYYYFMNDYRASTKGYLPRFGVIGTAFNSYDYDLSTAQAEEMDEECLFYLNKIKQLCDEKGAQLILTKFPTCWWTLNKSLTIQQWADANGVTYLDYNANEELRNMVGIDWSTDSLDGGNHLNYDGSMKMTAVMGNYLADNFAFEDKRANPDYSKWSEDFDYYKKCITNYRMADVNDMTAYLDILEENDYIIGVSINNADIGQQQDEIYTKLLNMGISEAFLQNSSGMANLCILDCGINKFEGTDVLQINYDEKIANMQIKAQSTLTNGNTKLLLTYDKKEYVKEQNGIQIFIIDPTTEKYVDMSVWQKDATGVYCRVK